jgi:hypothetical protein
MSGGRSLRHRAMNGPWCTSSGTPRFRTVGRCVPLG